MIRVALARSQTSPVTQLPAKGIDHASPARKVVRDTTSPVVTMS